MESVAEESRQEAVVHRLGAEGSELAVFEFQDKLRDTIISNLREGYLTAGSYVPGAKAVSPQGARSLAVSGAAAGATAMSAAFSSTLYVATANPATLMTVGGGVGSAVMGGSGIVGQAAFIPVASTLPVVAPVLAIQALSTAVTMQQFKQVDQKLDSIKRALDQAIARMEATHAGELFAASKIVDDVYEQYSLEGSFSNDMLVRLSLAERDMGALAARFRNLVEVRDVTTFDENTNFEQVKYDDHSAMLASLTQLRISYLRVCVNMQENPNSVSASVKHLKSSIEEGIEFWEFLLNRSPDLKNKIDELKQQLGSMPWSKRNLPRGEGSSVERDLDNLQNTYTSIVEGERELMSEFSVLIDSAGKAREALESSYPSDADNSPTLVYWQDEAGEHAFVTEKRLIS